MTNLKVSLGFVELSDPALDEFAANVVNGLNNNPGFPDLPVGAAALGTMRVAYHEGLVAAADGGRRSVAVKNEARSNLVTGLRQDAAYVQSVAGQDMVLLVSSGFKPVSTNRTSAPLATPTILNVDNQSTTRLFIDLSPVANVAAYQVRLIAPQGPSLPTVESTRSRKIEAPGLVPGTVYTVQARAIGGSTGYSDWSLPATIMAT